MGGDQVPARGACRTREEGEQPSPLATRACLGAGPTRLLDVGPDEDPFLGQDPFGHGGSLDADIEEMALPDSGSRPAATASPSAQSAPAGVRLHPSRTAEPSPKRFRLGAPEAKRDAAAAGLSPLAGPPHKKARDVPALETQVGAPSSKRPRLAAPPTATAPVVLGHTVLHDTHAVIYSRGCCVCLRCLAYATQAPRKLALPCEGRPSPLRHYGKEILARVCARKFPRCGLSWPSPEEAADWVLLQPAAGSVGASAGWTAAGPADHLLATMAV